MHYGASKLIFQRAEELRKFCTWEEEIVWGYLGSNKLGKIQKATSIIVLCS